jgi:hypothetical protein
MNNETVFILVSRINSKEELRGLLSSENAFTRMCAEHKLLTFDQGISSLDEI